MSASSRPPDLFEEVGVGVLGDEAGAATTASGRWRYVRGRLWRKPSFVIGATVLLGWVVIAVFWPLLAPFDPYRTGVGPALQAPSSAHLLGTDDLGRDVLSRVMAGSSDVLTIAPLATLLGVALGTSLGLVAGFLRGIVDTILMRVTDIFLAFPTIIASVMVVSAIGSSEWALIVVIGVFFAPIIARTVRSAVLVQRERQFVDAARIRGEHAPYIMLREILPNVTGPILVEATVRLGYAVFTAATLAFLGFSLQPPSADWGVTIASERGYIQTAPWVVLAPAAALASLVLAVHFVADALRTTLEEA